MVWDKRRSPSQARRAVITKSWHLQFRTAALDVIATRRTGYPRHTPGLRTCRPPLASFLQWRGWPQL